MAGVVNVVSFFDSSDYEEEYECSLRYELTEAQFQYFSKFPVIEENVITYYDRYRSVDGKVQKKIITKSAACAKLVIYDNRIMLLPFTVTEGVEIPFEPKLSDIFHTLKHRRVLFLFPSAYNGQYGHVRIGTEVNISEDGGKYFYVAEFETGYSIRENMNIFRTHAEKFWEINARLLLPIYGTLKNTLFDPVAPSSFHCAKSRRFLPLSKFKKFGSNRDIYTYKYDGGKAKYIYNYGFCAKNRKNYEGFGLMLDCRNNISYVEMPPIFQAFPNVIFQFENMQQARKGFGGIRNSILVDCCGGFKNGKQHLMLPGEALALIQYFKIPNPAPIVGDLEFEDVTNVVPHDNYLYLTLWKNEDKREIEAVYRLCAQSPIKGEPFDKIDGKLIIAGVCQTKLKIPTIDVQIVNGHIKSTLLNFKQKLNVEDGIYEVIISEDRKLVIIRQRFDRSAASADSGVESFINDWEYIYGKPLYPGKTTQTV